MFTIEAVPISCCMLHCMEGRFRLASMCDCKYADVKTPLSYSVRHRTLSTPIL